MKRGLCLLLLFIVACTSAQYAGQAGRGASGLQEVVPAVRPQQPIAPSRAVQPITEAPPQTLSVPGSRAGARGCVDKAGSACNRNQCGGTGVVNCDGSCSAQLPVIPSNLGSACNRNQCGGTGIVQCGGVCSAAAPNVPANLGSSCGCGGVIQCNGACTSSGCPSGSSCQNGQCVAPQCTDTDGGPNYGVQGTTTGYTQGPYGKSSYPLTRTDYCESSTRLREYYCSNGYVGPGATEIYSIEGIAVCPCQNGRCV